MNSRISGQSNKGMKQTKPGPDGASQLIPVFGGRVAGAMNANDRVRLPARQALGPSVGG